MKFLLLFLLLSLILLTHAQRRTSTAKSVTEPESPKPPSRGRGRSRFVASPEYSQLKETSSTTELSSRKTIASRRRVVENVEPKFASRTPVAPKSIPSRRPASSLSETADKIFLNDNVDRKPARASFSSRTPSRIVHKKQKTSYEVEEIVADDPDPFKKSKKPRVYTEVNFNYPKRTAEATESSTSVPKTSPESPSSTNLIDEQPDSTLKPEPESPAPTEIQPEDIQKSSTTRPKTPEPTRKQGPNRRTVLRKKPQEPPAPNSTTKRTRTRTRATQRPDYYFQSVSTSVPSSAFRRRVDNLFASVEPRTGPSVFNADSTPIEYRSRTGRKIDASPERVTLPIPGRGRRVTTPRSVETTAAARSRGRFRQREMPVIDERKLEVLPLFEEEPKVVPTTRGGRRFQQEPAGAQVVVFREKPPAVSNATAGIDAKTFKPQIKESVVSEVNEVTSKRKVPRKKIIKQKVTAGSRGSKKSEVKLEKKHGSEEIDETDNYPEEFKALIKAKKEHKKPTSTVTTPTTRSGSVKLNDNKLVPSLKPSRQPPSSTTMLPSSSKVPARASTSLPVLPKGSKYFPRSNNSISKPERNYPFKPAKSGNEATRTSRGRSTFSAKHQDNNRTSTKAVKKYRGSTTTNAPRYIPTIPSAPYVPTVPVVARPGGVARRAYHQDDIAGLQVISIDEPVPVHAIRSANLVSGDYQNSSSIPKPLPLVSDGTTEKPASIIERIINSITARSTVSPSADAVIKITASTTESPSAILKLAPKRQIDSTDETRQQTNLVDSIVLTTENPTTIIEKILSSLNAIQATDNAGVQVGTDFNTLSSFTTTPLPSVTKSSTRSLLALDSTSVVPLSILDEIPPEDILQKQAIGRLLDLLNGLVSTRRTDEVVVTPVNFGTFSSDSTMSSAPSTISLSTITATPEVLSTVESTTSTAPTTTEDFVNNLTESTTISSTDSTAITTESTTVSTESTTISTESTTIGPESSTFSNEVTTSFPSTTEVGINSTEGINFFNLFSTLPSLQKFEVTPGSVSVFSANDLSNSITSEDYLVSTTVNIPSRTTAQSTTTEAETVTTEMTTSSGPMQGSSRSNSSSTSTPVIVNNTSTNVSVDTSTPDYFVFAVLNNNTVLRKRPIVPKAPFFVIGVYPNNTVVKKYPNGTVVPMEMTIRVRGFDTRENPPPLPVITSNQVTSESGSTVDNKIVETDELNTIPTGTKPLSTTPTSAQFISTSTSPNTISTSSTSEATVTPESSTVRDTATERTLPMLSDLLNGNIVEAFNEIVNKTDNSNYEPAKYTQVLNIQDLIKGGRQDENYTRRPSIDKVEPTTMQSTTSTSATTSSSSVESPSTKIESTTDILLSNRILDDTSTTSTTIKPTKGRRLTSTPIPIPTTTYFPTFISTLFPNLFEATTPKTTKKPQGVVRISAPPTVTETMLVASSTTNPTTIKLATTTTSKPTTTTTRRVTRPTTTTTTRRPTTTTRPPTTTTRPTTTRPTTVTRPARSTTSRPSTTTTRYTTTRPVTVVTSTKRNTDRAGLTTQRTLKVNELTKEQRDNLKMIAQLEKEQAQLLQQLSLLTSLGLGGNRGAKSSNKNSKSLAERIVALAAERGTGSTASSPVDITQPPKSIQDKLPSVKTTNSPDRASSLDDVLKQLNQNVRTTPSKPTTIRSEDAILNSLLKEQGILPPTPKSLAGIYEETTIRPRARTTTPQPGPIMRGLNWLMNALAPTTPAPRKPTRKPTKPKKPPVDLELLANSPTHVTPVVTPAPSKLANALSQDDIKKLINQLEGIQKNPKETLDLSQIKSIQSLINLDDEGVVVMTNGEHGTTARRPPTSSPKIRQTTERQPRILSTSPDNSLDEFEFESTTRAMRAPIGFRPVPGVDDNPDSLVRSNLITAAVNVTKAISGFLGTALQTVSQGAASSFSSLFGGSGLGTRLLGNAAVGSSAG